MPMPVRSWPIIAPCRLTDRVVSMSQVAQEKGLSEPLGRAIYAASRVLNAGAGSPDPSMERIMEPAKHVTAVKWRAYWERGGALKTLQYNHEEWARRRREQSDRPLTEGQRLRRNIRRARRGLISGSQEADL